MFASLVLFGRDLDPDVATRVLGACPSDAAHRGRVDHEAGRMRVAPQGRWCLSSDGKVAGHDLDAHVAYLLDVLEPNVSTVSALPGVEEAAILVYWASATGTGGPSLSPSTLGRIARNQLCLWFDVYFVGSGQAPGPVGSGGSRSRLAAEGARPLEQDLGPEELGGARTPR